MTSSKSKLDWKPQKDNFTEALTPQGKIYLNHDREGKVRSAYSCFGDTRKVVIDPPLPASEAKLYVEELLSQPSSPLLP